MSRPGGQRECQVLAFELVGSHDDFPLAITGGGTDCDTLVDGCVDVDAPDVAVDTMPGFVNAGTALADEMEREIVGVTLAAGRGIGDSNTGIETGNVGAGETIDGNAPGRSLSSIKPVPR